MENQNLYMPNDKAICDAVKSSKITNQRLAEIFFKRGIIISPDTDRHTLALYYSRMFTGYTDFDELTYSLQSISQREKITSRFITNSTSTEILAAANKLKEIINSKDYPQDASATISKYADETIITITYSDINPNKSQLQQTVTKEAIINITSTPDELILRSPFNDNSEKWVNHLIEILSEQKNPPPKIDTISLEFIDSPKLRSQFLEDLTKQIKDFDLKDVSKVSVFNPEKTTPPPSELSDTTQQVDISSETHVFKASLNGKGVLNSGEIDHLYEKGFYAFHVTWTCIEKNATPDIYEIEVKFEDSENCKNLSYKVKGFYKYMSVGKHSSNRQPSSGAMERDIQTKIEHTARKTIAKFQEDIKASSHVDKSSSDAEIA